MNRKARKRTKMRVIRKLLTRKNGCTAAEVKKAVGWPSVSIPQRAKQLGIKVRLERRYFSI